MLYALHYTSCCLTEQLCVWFFWIHCLIVSSFWYTLVFTIRMFLVIYSLLALNKEQSEVRLLFNFNNMLFKYSNVNSLFDDLSTSTWLWLNYHLTNLRWSFSITFDVKNTNERQLDAVCRVNVYTCTSIHILCQPCKCQRFLNRTCELTPLTGCF